VRFGDTNPLVQVPFVEDDHLVEQIAAHGLDPAFSNAFCQGLCGVICLRRIPLCSNTARTSVPYFLSLSKMR
jgi:hypothetical protein